MKKGLLALLLILIFTSLVACSKDDHSNKNKIATKKLYELAVQKTNQLKVKKYSIVGNSNTLETEGELIYNLANNQLYFKGMTPGLSVGPTEILNDNGSIYMLDTNQNKYVYIDKNNKMSEYMNELLSTSTLSTISIAHDQLIDILKDDYLKCEDTKFMINDENIQVTKITFNIPQDIHATLVKDTFFITLEKAVDYQVELYLQLNNSFIKSSSPDSIHSRENIRIMLLEQYKTLYDNMKISDIKYSVLIDKNNIIRHIEESYKSTIPSQETTDTNSSITLVDYGDDIMIPHIDKSNTVNYEDMF